MKIKLLLVCSIIFAMNFNFYGKSALFKVEVPKKNMKWNEINQNDMYIKVKISQNDKELKSYENGTYKLIKKEIVILDSDENKVNKIKVSYKATESDTNDNGTKTNLAELPVLNKTYLIERIAKDVKSDIKFNVTNEKGETPSKEELDYILKEDYDKDNDLDFNATELKDKNIEIGDKIDSFNYIFDNFLGNLNGDDNAKNDKKDYSVVLKDIKKINGKDCGIFDLNYKINYKDSGTGLEGNLVLKGEIIIVINTSQLLRISFKGPLTMKGSIVNEKDKMDVDGSGNIDYLYDQPEKL